MWDIFAIFKKSSFYLFLHKLEPNGQKKKKKIESMIAVDKYEGIESMNAEFNSIELREFKIKIMLISFVAFYQFSEKYHCHIFSENCEKTV